MTDTVRRGKAQQPLELDTRLEGWALRGATVATLGGRQVSIDHGIPGELVSATVDRRRKPWRGVVDRVLEPSPDRVEAPCKYFSAGCGGCQWQHMRYGAQLE